MGDAAVKDISSGSTGTVTAPGFGGAIAPAAPPSGIPLGAAGAIRKLVATHNVQHGKDPKRRADHRALIAVYRRGAHKSDDGTTARQNGVARVREQLSVLASGERAAGGHKNDDDLLPAGHPRRPVEAKSLTLLLALEGKAIPTPTAVAAALEEKRVPFEEDKHPRAHGRFAHAFGNVDDLKAHLRAGGDREGISERAASQQTAVGAELADDPSLALTKSGRTFVASHGRGDWQVHDSATGLSFGATTSQSTKAKAKRLAVHVENATPAGSTAAEIHAAAANGLGNKLIEAAAAHDTAEGVSETESHARQQLRQREQSLAAASNVLDATNGTGHTEPVSLSELRDGDDVAIVHGATITRGRVKKWQTDPVYANDRMRSLKLHNDGSMSTQQVDHTGTGAIDTPTRDSQNSSGNSHGMPAFVSYFDRVTRVPKSDDQATVDHEASKKITSGAGTFAPAVNTLEPEKVGRVPEAQDYGQHVAESNKTGHNEYLDHMRLNEGDHIAVRTVDADGNRELHRGTLTGTPTRTGVMGDPASAVHFPLAFDHTVQSLHDDGTAGHERAVGADTVTTDPNTFARRKDLTAYDEEGDVIDRHTPGQMVLKRNPVEVALETKAGLWDGRKHPRSHGRFAHVAGPSGSADNDLARSLLGGSHAQMRQHAPDHAAQADALAARLSGTADGHGRPEPDHLSDPQLHAAHKAAVATLRDTDLPETTRATAEVQAAQHIAEIGRRGMDRVAPADDSMHDTHTAAVHAHGALLKARKHEPQITSDLLDVSSEHDGRMKGLEHRVKSHDSLTRKIRDKAGRPTADGGKSTQADEAARAADIIRYTALLDHENYGKGAQGMLDGLAAKGHTVDKVDNLWDGNREDYRGLHADMRGPDWHKYELQFHTPDSFEAKTKKLHADYEIARDPERSPKERSDALARMKVTASAVKVPEGATDVHAPDAGAAQRIAQNTAEHPVGARVAFSEGSGPLSHGTVTGHTSSGVNVRRDAGGDVTRLASDLRPSRKGA